MIFWIFAGLTLLGIGILIIQNICIEKYEYNGKDNTSFVSFVWDHEEPVTITGVAVAIVSGIIASVMLLVIILTQITADGEKSMMEQRYKALIYKSQIESIRDDFGIVNKEYIDEIQKWNEDLAKYQSYSDNIWFSVFFPKRIYEDLQVIDLENIKIKD